MTGSGRHDGQALALVLSSLGALAALVGARAVLLGAREVAGTESVHPRVDSEYRFYAAWYLLAGVFLSPLCIDSASVRRKVHFVSAGLWTAAAGRLLSLRQSGRPSASQLLLLGAELALPMVLLPWHARVSRHRKAPEVVSLTGSDCQGS